jgi:hypothetical protein
MHDARAVASFDPMQMADICTSRARLLCTGEEVPQITWRSKLSASELAVDLSLPTSPVTPNAATASNSAMAMEPRAMALGHAFTASVTCKGGKRDRQRDGDGEHKQLSAMATESTNNTAEAAQWTGACWH